VSGRKSQRIEFVSSVVGNKGNNAMNSKYVRWIEAALLIVGVLLITIFVTAHIHREVLSRSALDDFKAAKEHADAKDAPSLWDKKLALDSSLWSSVRIAEYEQSLASHFDPPLAILRIPNVRLEVVVLAGTDDLTLNRGVGLIEGTNRPGEGGKIGIAGHRDGFFRVLKDVHRGDTIELETLDRVDRYRVDEIVIVSPQDVSVLRPTTAPTLSLVTCYPFYFIGSAPERYIVTASLTNSRRPAGDNGQQQNTTSVRFEPAVHNSSLQTQDSTKETTQ
jgi:sortase A